MRAFTRLSWISGHRWLAGIVAVAACSFVHLPSWDAEPVLSCFVVLGLAMAFFAWRLIPFAY